jgi:hypothetical protein
VVWKLQGHGYPSAWIASWSVAGRPLALNA